MKQKQFGEFLRNPELTNASSVALFEELVERYPFCQIGQILFTYNLLKTDNYHYPAQLRTAAAYAGDRKMLKILIESARQEVDGPPPVLLHPIVGQDQPTPTTTEIPEEIPIGILPDEQIQSNDFGAVSQEELDSIPAYEYQTESPTMVTWEFMHPIQEANRKGFVPDGATYERMTQEELLAIVKKRLAEISAAHHQEQFSNVSDGSPVTLVDSSGNGASSGASKQYLIDKFIRDEPRISKPHANFFNPTESAVRSNYDDEEIVSETLAQLYAEQGNVPKAIHIYQKLSLLNQEKSRYFAAQIEKLNI